MQLNCGYLTIELYSIKLFVSCALLFDGKFRQWLHLVDES